MVMQGFMLTAAASVGLMCHAISADPEVYTALVNSSPSTSEMSMMRQSSARAAETECKIGLFAPPDRSWGRHWKGICFVRSAKETE
ncbi:hypothetical protein ABZ942_33070 [Nocardia sp. NPDC046473]|uniref:hypothetical protein n=1 Tax=Nocardia sp. NPDC046473 TaxID=3155733 RepID=UPI0033E23EB4